MAWSSSHICVAGPDKKVVFYTMEGMMAQQFDYFRSEEKRKPPNILVFIPIEMQQRKNSPRCVSVLVARLFVWEAMTG